MYAVKTNVDIILHSIIDSVSTDLENYAITTAENWVNSKIGVITTTPTPSLISQAAEYFSAAFILRNLYDTDSEEAATAIWYEKMANDMLDAYQTQNPDTSDYDSPYSSSLTPTESYMERNVRTEYDPLRSKHDDVTNEWDYEG